MSSTVLNNTIITPGASIDGEYLNNGQPWASVQAYLDYKDNEFAIIPVPKTIFVAGHGEMWNKGTQSERVFIDKLPDNSSELTDAIIKTAYVANQTSYADVELKLNGYIDATTHEFVESNDYKCSGFVYVKGVQKIEYKTRSIGNSYHICFYDENKTSLPLLDFPVQNEGITGVLDLTQNQYSQVAYIILSAYPGGYPPYLRLRGQFDYTDTIKKAELTYRQGYNLFDVNKVQRGKLLTSGGTIQDNSGAILSNLIELPDYDRGRNGDLHIFNLPLTGSYKRFAYYDANKNLIGSTHDISASDTTTQLGCPSEAKYMLICVYMPGTTLPQDNTPMVNIMVTFWYSMASYQTHWKHIKTIDSNPLCASSVAGLYAGKNWAVIGDSLTERNQRSNKLYHDFVREALGFNVTNLGVSGTGYKTREDVDNASTNGAFYQRINTIPATTDVLTVFGSFNDLTQGFDLGTVSDSGTSTICGCMNTFFDNLFTTYPEIKLGVIAPCPWKEFNPTNTTAAEYVNALANICANRSIPFLDLFHCSGLRPWERSFRDIFYNQDAETNGDFHGTHPNEKGHELIGSKVREFIKTLI